WTLKLILPLTTSFSFLLMPCHGFSVDTEQPIIFRETVKSFGYSVVQFGSGINVAFQKATGLSSGHLLSFSKSSRPLGCLFVSSGSPEWCKWMWSLLGTVKRTVL
uniref:Integrin subunit alpha X n=1 Tax=Naja naja TaxID=35670 RepID=A0A8C6Y524_NAJNA